MDRWVLRNEFAGVMVAKDEGANGPRLIIRDLHTGREVYLDPLELEAITRIPYESYATWLDPDQLP